MKNLESLEFPQLKQMGYHVFFGVEKYFSKSHIISIELRNSLGVVPRYFTYQSMDEVEKAINDYTKHGLNIYFNRGNLYLDNKTGDKRKHMITGFPFSELLNLDIKNMFQKTTCSIPFENVLIFDHRDPIETNRYVPLNTFKISTDYVDELVILERTIH